MGGSSSKQIGNEFKNAFQPVAKALNPTQNGISHVFSQTIPKAITQTIPHALAPVANTFTKTLPAVAVSAGAVLSQNLNPNTNTVAASFNQIPAALQNTPVIGSLPITQLITGNTGGFVNSLQNEANIVSSTLGISSLTNSIGLTQPQQPPQQVGYAPYQPINVYNPPPQGSMTGVGTSSAPGSGLGSYTPSYANNMGAPPSYYGIPLDVWIVGGALAGFYLIS